FRISPQVPQDIGELERDTQVDRVFGGQRCAGAKYFETDQPDHRSHPVTVEPQVVERGVAPGGQVHVHSGEEVLEQLLGNLQAADVLGQADGHREGSNPQVGRVELVAPALELFARVAAGGRVVHHAVHFPAEGVHRVHGVAACRGQEEKGVVEIAPASLGD